MAKSLVIAEKPSVAADIAHALGKFTKEKDFFENDQYIISSALGHLVEIGAPAEEEAKRGKWSLQNLPVIPSHFELKPIEKTAARFNLLKKLMSRKDVNCLINACDAGREGELIFRYIVQLAGSTKPIQRLWLQSMTPDSIREKFSALLEDQAMQPLASAAVCRSEADWLVGINGTRALTAFNSQGGGFQKTTVGRVQTPTLTLLVDREEKIRKFEPQNYWELHATFDSSVGDYEGRWFDEKFKKSDDDRLKAERIWEKITAEEIARVCLGKPGVVTEESKPTTQLSPLLFDLTSLQRDANSRFGFPARMTLSIAQALYEKHKALTYPRTDSRYLPEDYLSVARKTFGAMQETAFGEFAQKILDSNWVKPNKRIFNQAKVSDHFAIIPTSHMPNFGKLTEPERKIYDMVARRFLAVFYPAAVYQITTRITRVEQHPFKTEGKILKEAGWLAVYGKEANQENANEKERSLAPLPEGERVTTREVETRECVTKPPPRFTEATLLSAMEGAGKFVEDEELRNAMAAKGLGTPATRAAIIEGLIWEKYVNREGRDLIPTTKAFHLLDTLRAMQILDLSSPELTGEWEHKLKLIEKSQLTRADFMSEIQTMTRDVVSKIKAFSPTQDSGREIDLTDPFSGQKMIETLRDYRSPDGSFTVRKAIAGRVMDLEEVKELLAKRVIGPLDGFRSKAGKPFSALVKLTDDKQVALDWGAPSSSDDAQQNFEGQEPIGVCPKDQGRIFETPNAFICENAAKSGKTCDFRIGAKILNQPISREQMIKLLQEGKTDLLTNFISQKTKRPFKAFLLLKKDGKIGFEFPPRAASAKRKAKPSS
ncbi:MAG: DNA topoisomerase III [bacterium]